MFCLCEIWHKKALFSEDVSVPRLLPRTFFSYEFIRFVFCSCCWDFLFNFILSCFIMKYSIIGFFITFKCFERMDFAALKTDFYFACPPLAAFTLVPLPIGPDQDIQRAGSRFGEQVLRFLFILDIYLFILQLMWLWVFFPPSASSLCSCCTESVVVQRDNTPCRLFLKE